jgi:hypothetical protein
MQRTPQSLNANPEATQWAQGNEFGVMVWLYVNGAYVTEILEPVFAG